MLVIIYVDPIIQLIILVVFIVICCMLITLVFIGLFSMVVENVISFNI